MVSEERKRGIARENERGRQGASRRKETKRGVGGRWAEGQGEVKEGKK